MRRKNFDRELYKKYDDMAKGYAVERLRDAGLKAVSNEKKTGVDLLIYRDGKLLFYCECEIKRALDKPFKYDTLQIPGRKQKFCELDKNTLFTLFSSDGSKMLSVWSKDILESPLREVSNRYMREGEYFFQVDINKTYSKIEDAVNGKDY